MKLSDLLLMSLESLFKRKVRTILTIMGVVIGTTSIVVMISLGIGMKEALLSEYESYGSLRSVEVESAGRYDDSGKEKNPEDTLLNDAKIEEFMSIDHVTSVDPVLSTQVVIKCGIYECNTELLGVSRDVLEEKADALGQGSVPAEGEGLQLIWGNCMPAYFVNTKTNQYEYWETGKEPDIDLMNDQLFVIFDTEKYYQSQYGSEDGSPVSAPKKYIVPTAGVIAGGLDDYNEDSYYVYCDIEVLKEVLSREFRGRVIPGQPTRKNGKPYKELFYTRVNVNVDEMDNVTQVQQIINDMGYRAYSNAEWIESDMKIMNIIQAVLGGIGGISLFVAAIGIMKVIGCRIRDIQFLFLIEAGYIGFIGGGIGMILSYGISYVMNRVLGLGDMMFEEGAKLSVIPPWLALLAITFAALIAMLAGFLPSLRAMKLSPLAAIRAE